MSGGNVSESVSAPDEAMSTFFPFWSMLYIGAEGLLSLPGISVALPCSGCEASVLWRKTKRVPSAAMRTPPNSV